jgi:hypothetical protein
MEKMKMGGRGVESPIPTDAALIGDTRQELHTKNLPRCMGPNFGYGGKAVDDDYRITGDNANGESK